MARGDVSRIPHHGSLTLQIAKSQEPDLSVQVSNGKKIIFGPYPLKLRVSPMPMMSDIIADEELTRTAICGAWLELVAQPKFPHKVMLTLLLFWR